MIARALVALTVVVVLLLPTSATAQEPPRERQFVYGLNMFDGVTYASGFVPRAVDTIYAMADADSVLDPKYTEVYFWPITNEYRPDFTTLNELVPGTLEIAEGGRLIVKQEMTPYVVQFDQARNLANGRLYLGDAAARAWGRFQDERASYLERLRQYTDATQAFDQKLDEMRRRSASGEKVTAPDPPDQPAAFTLYSTEVARGFPIHLTAGEYQIHVRDERGQIVPGSEKRLIAIAPRRRGFGYEVVPQEKWTYPETANDPTSAIYTVPDGVLYLRPFAELEFNTLEYARLQNPQDVQATSNRWTWVHTAALADATLAVRSASAEQRLEMGQFAVEQIPGAALGYQVVPFEPKPSDPRQPDLTAFRVVAPDRRTALSVLLLDQNGRELAGSARRIVVSSSIADWQLALPVLVPLAIGLTVALWRRDQVQSMRSLTPEQRQLVA